MHEMCRERKMSERTINEWADFWRNDIGVNVIPANTKYKKPIVAWTEWQDKAIPLEIHEQWKREDKFKNGMAVIAGMVWHNDLKRGLYLGAIDCDNRLGIEEMAPSGMDRIATKTLVEMHMDDTSKCHVYFYTHQPMPKKSSDVLNATQASQIQRNTLPALEVKGDGKHGIMYVTPSVHKNGTRYEILGVEEPMLFDNAVTVVNEVCKKYGVGYLDNVKNGSANSSLVPMDEVLNDTSTVQEGSNRHLALLRYADHVWKVSPSTITDQLIFDMVMAKNNLMCKPPLSGTDVSALVKQAKEQVEKWNQAENNDAMTRKAKAKTHAEYADDIMQLYDFATMDDTDETLYYNEGVYIFGGEIQIKKQCEQEIYNCKREDVGEIIAAIKRRTYHSRNEFDSDMKMINLKNCWVNIETGETASHTSKILSRIQLPIFYDPSKVPIKFNRFLRQCHNNPKDVYTIYEEFASILIKSPKFQKAFMHIGQGANGKSVYLNLIKHLIGGENISNVSIQTLETNRFAPAELDSKMANIYADISSEELKLSGTFKNAVSGDPIMVEKKNKDPFQLINYAKMFFSTNQIPIVYDQTDGFFRRWILVDWLQVFDDRTANIHLLSELTTEEEKSGIFNMLICFARKLEARGHFKYTGSTEHVREMWKKKSDSVGGFLETCVIYESNLHVIKTRLYDAYLKYCAEHKLSPLTSPKFNYYLKQNSILEDDGKPIQQAMSDKSWAYLGHDVKLKTVRVWTGGMLKTDDVIDKKLKDFDSK